MLPPCSAFSHRSWIEVRSLCLWKEHQQLNHFPRIFLQLFGLRWVWLSSLAWSTFYAATCLGLPNMGIMVLNSHTWLPFSSKWEKISPGWRTHWLFLQRTWIPFSTTIWQLSSVCDFCSRGSNTLSSPPGVPGMHKMYIHTYIQTTLTHLKEKQTK